MQQGYSNSQLSKKRRLFFRYLTNRKSMVFCILIHQGITERTKWMVHIIICFAKEINR